MDDFQIIELSPSDATAFKAIRLRGLREHPEAFGEAAEDLEARPVEATAERIQSLREGGGFILAARQQGDLIGVVGIRPEPGRKNCHRAFLWGMYVPRERQGQGIGRRLIEAALQRCRATPQIEFVRLSVMSVNHSALRLYQSLGFEQYGLEPRSLRVNGKDYEEILMRIAIR